MQQPLPSRHPCIGMRIGDLLRPAVPVHLDGHTASMRLEEEPPRTERASLHLGWADGRVTELEVRVRAVDAPRHVAHMDICRVLGDWRPFLEYLALAACA